MAKTQLRTRWRFVLDADYGERKVPHKCALVHDLQDTYPTLQRPHITDKVITFTYPATGERLTWKTPKHIANWITRWDNGENPAPIPVILYRRDAKIETLDVRRAKKGSSPTGQRKAAKNEKAPKKQRLR